VKGDVMNRQSLFTAAIVMFVGLSGTAYAAKGDAQVDTSVPNAPVPYPDTAQRNNEQGTVRMLVKISAFGHPTEIKVVKSSGHDDLDTAAAEGVMRWHFLPASYGSDWADVQVMYQEPAMTPAAAVTSTAPSNH
jgi:TonB family protein